MQFSIVRKIYEREPADPLEDLNVNAAIWGILLRTTHQAAVHLGQDCETKLRCTIRKESSLEQLFNETGRLIRDQTKIIGVTMIDFKELT